MFFIFLHFFWGVVTPASFQDINVQNGGERLADALRQVLSPAEVVRKKNDGRPQSHGICVALCVETTYLCGTI